MSAIDLLHAANPTPPPDAAVGRSPISYLNQLPAAAVHIAGTAGYPTAAPLTRGVLRAICLDPAVTPLAKYACIMAWGGQRFGNFDTSCRAPALEPLILALLASANNRQIDFAATQAAAARIRGLGISFYTKLLFFLRPVQDAYILDQWTAKSILLLRWPQVVRLGTRGHQGFYRARAKTTQQEYGDFCQTVEDLRTVLWPGYPAATAEQVEMAMFDRNRPDGCWRGFVRICFKHPVAGNLLANGGESLTQAHDYRCGLLVIRRIAPPRLFVIGIHGSCCHWSSDDCYRLLLARLRELLAQHNLPITLVLPPGPCPQWFTDALQALGIQVETTAWSEKEASSHPDADDTSDEGEDAQACEVDHLTAENYEEGAKPRHNDCEQDDRRPVGVEAKENLVDCEKCQLGKYIVEAHRVASASQQLPQTPSEPQHSNPHRLVCQDRDGIAWQYHINDKSVRIDCWLHGKGVLNYDIIRKRLSMATDQHDFGNQIFGNGANEGQTRSISKNTTLGMNESANALGSIAKEAVEIMSQIFTLISPHV